MNIRIRYAEPGDNDDALCQKLTGVFEVCSRQSSVPVLMTGLEPVFSSHEFRFPVDIRVGGVTNVGLKHHPCHRCLL